MSAIDHQAFAETLRKSVLEGPAGMPAGLRQAFAARAVGGPPVDAPLDALVRQIGEDAARVTDAQVAAVVETLGERGAFEVIVAAALGAGLHRWRRGLAALEEATCASA